MIDPIIKNNGSLIDINDAAVPSGGKIGEFLQWNGTDMVWSSNGDYYTDYLLSNIKTYHTTMTTEDYSYLSFILADWSKDLNSYCVVLMYQVYDSNYNTSIKIKSAISPDGINWTQYDITSQLAESLITNHDNAESFSMCWASAPINKFVIIAKYTDLVWTSPDGTTWTEESPSWGVSPEYYSLLYVEDLGTLFAVDPYRGKISSTVDGSTWTETSLPEHGDGYGPMCWIPDYNMLCFTENENVYTSYEGTSWTKVGTLDNYGYSNMCWSSKLQLICLSNKRADYPDIALSSTGATWQYVEVPLASSYYGLSNIMWCEPLEMFLSIYQYYDSYFITSTNGIVWSNKTTNVSAYDSFKYNETLKTLFAVSYSYIEANNYYKCNIDLVTTLPLA